MSIRDALNSELGREVKRLREENEEVHAAAVQKQKELMEMRMDMVTEECPDCGTENTLERSPGWLSGILPEVWIPYDVMW